jgi:hypothetical protein
MEATGEDPFLERIQASTVEFLRSQIISAESEPRE